MYPSGILKTTAPAFCFAPGRGRCLTNAVQDRQAEHQAAAVNDEFVPKLHGGVFLLIDFASELIGFVGPTVFNSR
jgi:hypothetical protein